MLAGFASMMAYGGTFERQGTLAGLRKIAMRCLRLYLFQVGLLVATWGIVRAWTNHFNLAILNMAPLMNSGLSGLRKGLTLQAQPSDLNILPLYIALLAVFPPIYALMHVRPRLMVFVSFLLWLATHFHPALNFTNAMDGQVWFFNPFAWQFLFVIGAFLAVQMRKQPLPHAGWLVAACWLFLLAAFMESAPWQDWDLPNLSPFALNPPDKTNLSPLRLLHVMAVAYLILSWPGLMTILRGPFLGPVVAGVEACGKHSLEVFSLGTLLALLGRLSFRTYGMTEWVQLLVNVLGLAAMVGLGLALERSRSRVRQSAVKHICCKIAVAGHKLVDPNFADVTCNNHANENPSRVPGRIGLAGRGCRSLGIAWHSGARTVRGCRGGRASGRRPCPGRSAVAAHLRIRFLLHGGRRGEHAGGDLSRPVAG
ncbi:MAG: OpgC domain-containing protein [Acetobacteraceae bacterium]